MNSNRSIVALAALALVAGTAAWSATSTELATRETRTDVLRAMGPPDEVGGNGFMVEFVYSSESGAEARYLFHDDLLIGTTARTPERPRNAVWPELGAAVGDLPALAEDWSLFESSANLRAAGRDVHVVGGIVAFLSDDE